MNNSDIEKNDVPAVNQTNEKVHITTVKNPKLKVLIMGNSITLHEKAPHIGWNLNCGMAASAPENDYVHVILKNLTEKYGQISSCVVNVADFERNYFDESTYYLYEMAKDFSADLVIYRFGENVKRDRFDEFPLAPYLEKFFNHFAHNTKKVIVTDTFWAHEYICSSIKTACEKIGAEFVSLSDLGNKDENKAIGLFENQGVARHPGDLGMKRIAERILEKI
ncbi:MAG: hypothetical protein J6V68_02650 [Clostridia bacterium]|nr:hypothetical protein [Clostridia bacterium]